MSISYVDLIHSLIKMLYWMCKKSRSRPLTWPQMKHAIMRNFGGLKSDEVDPFEIFCKKLNMAEEEPDPDEYVEDQEVAINNQLSFVFYLYMYMYTILCA